MKKKLLAVLSATVMSVSVLLTSGITAKAEEVDIPDNEIIKNDETGIPDQNLYNLALEQGDSNNDGILTKEEAASVTRISVLEGRGIENLQGIQYFTNISELCLEDNQIRDISALSGLTELQNLQLSDNQISDINALSGLTKLQSLHMENNQISDISALSDLTELSVLLLSNNQISNISALSGLTEIDYLYLSDNQISDISALSGLTKMKRLFISNNQISDISVLTNFTELWDLDVSYNQITEVPSLDWNHFSTLDLSNNKISDLSVMKDYQFENVRKDGEYTIWGKPWKDDIFVMGGYYPSGKIHSEFGYIGVENPDGSIILTHWKIGQGNNITREHEMAILPANMVNAKIVDAASGEIIGTWIELVEGYDSISVTEDTTISSDEFTSLLEKNQSGDVAIRSNDDLHFIFKQGTMKAVEGIDKYDFSTTINKDFSKVTDLPSQVTSSNFVAKIDYNYSGQLPAKASIQIYVGKDYAGQKLYYSQLMSDTSVALVQTVTVDAEGYIMVEQDHCSSYIITKEALSAEETTTEAPKSEGTTTAVGTTTNGTPATGDTSMPWVYGTLAVSALAGLLVLKRKSVVK